MVCFSMLWYAIFVKDNYIIWFVIVFYNAFCYLLYIYSYRTILAYSTDIGVISLLHVYTVPRRGIEPGASWLQVRSATDYPWTFVCLKHVYKPNNVFNYEMLIIKRLKQSNLLNEHYLKRNSRMITRATSAK